MKKIYLLATCLLMFGCAGGESSSSNNLFTWSEIATTGELASNVKKKYLIFDNQQSLSNTFMELSIADQNIDFSEHKVIMLGIGEHGEGDSLSINSIEEYETYIQVNIDVNRLDDHCNSIDIAYSPKNTFYKIESTKETIINEQQKIQGCLNQ